jgi:hypothetical protein
MGRTDLVPPLLGQELVSTSVGSGVVATPGETTFASTPLIAGNTTIANATFGYYLQCGLADSGGTGVTGGWVTYTVPASAG